MAVTMHPVSSAGISAIGRDQDTGLIHITFKSGGTHKFGPFSAEEYERFSKAESTGKHFHAHIRSKAVK